MQGLEGGKGSADIDPKPPVLCVITSPTRGRPGGRDGTTERRGWRLRQWQFPHAGG